MIGAEVLHGYSYENAKCYGMPHFMARYKGGDYRKYEKEPEAVCMVCGSPATDTHHQPSRGIFDLRTKWGIFALMPALITLCRGCHEKVEHSEILIRWEWNDGETEALWWSGWLPSHGYPAHSPRLYELGGWKVEQV